MPLRDELNLAQLITEGSHNPRRENIVLTSALPPHITTAVVPGTTLLLVKLIISLPLVESPVEIVDTSLCHKTRPPQTLPRCGELRALLPLGVGLLSNLWMLLWVPPRLPTPLRLLLLLPLPLPPLLASLPLLSPLPPQLPQKAVPWLTAQLQGHHEIEASMNKWSLGGGSVTGI